MKAGDAFAQVGSIIASLMFVWAMFQQYFPYQLRHNIEKYSQRVFSFVYPYIQITFNEFTGERLMRSELHSAIENYLSSNSSMQAKRLKADILKNNQSLVLSMDDHEEVADEFQGIKMWWASGKNISKSQTLSFYPATDEKRYYKLTFHKQHRNLVIGPYLSHVLKEGRAIKVRNRQRKLYTNNGSHWSHVMFEHPATFDTLGMEAEKKKEILEDLITFSQAEEFYARIGRAWKRGYLLYGPPGTGKSTMIAAIANLLNYDIYDLELTAVKDNTELRKLLIETSSKSVVKTNDKEEATDEKDQKPKQPKEDREAKPSQVTLSGLLNFIDGLWSACGGERLIVFTTNHKGRMDKHIELSYCSFEAFRVLAKNYLLLHDHQLFDKIRQLLLETKMTPADVAEHLMPKTVPPNPEVCLNSLVQSLEAAQEEAREKNSEKEISAIEDTKEENKEAPAGTGRDESKYKQQ
ncbi:AAA-ATPase ASD, mitochondrial [Linum perenne]